MTRTLQTLLKISSAQHDHLCPRQVLGVRMAILAGKILGLSLPQSDKRLLTIAETDGCAVDGLIAGTGCTPGHRTLRIEDYGKVAATFVDTVTSSAIRIVPNNDVRKRAYEYAPAGSSKWETYLTGYQNMPDDMLFSVRQVILNQSIEQVISRPGLKETCALCGEEIINGREILIEGKSFCRSCSGDSYYQPASDDVDAELAESHHLL